MKKALKIGLKWFLISFIISIVGFLALYFGSSFLRWEWTIWDWYGVRFCINIALLIGGVIFISKTVQYYDKKDKDDDD